jgi:pSer/pThr/pTyr-binding forkhead associated (FHA) protein
MAKIVVSIDGVAVKEVQLTKERTTLGRRPYNDVVIDNLAVSGEHAVFQLLGMDVFLEDLGSTNGTYVNGKAIKRQQLRSGDTIEVGKYRIHFTGHDPADSYEKTTLIRPGTAPLADASAAGVAVAARATGRSAQQTATADALIRVLSGPAAGREVQLVKVVTTIGKPGVAVAAITRRPHGFVLAHVEGTVRPLVNGSAIGEEVVQLHSGDTIELAGTRMQFMHA